MRFAFPLLPFLPSAYAVAPIILRLTSAETRSVITLYRFNLFLNSAPTIRNFFILDIVCSTTTLAFPNSLLNHFCDGVSALPFLLLPPLRMKGIRAFSSGKIVLDPVVPWVDPGLTALGSFCRLPLKMS